MVGDPFARLAVADMTEVGALMQSTGESLVASNHAKMSSLWVRVRSLVVPHWTADLLAPVLSALLQLVADSLALEVPHLVYLLLGHEFQELSLRIVDLVALNLNFGPSAST